MGDFNICAKQNSSMFKKYSDILQSFSLKQLINEPTRVTSTSSSVIDHVICNPIGRVSKSGVLDIGLSDHQFTFFMRGRLHSPCFEPVVHRFRSMKHYCKELFCIKLREVDWNLVLLETDVEMALKNFTETLLGVINKIAPYHEMRVKHDSAPWMCREILVAIRRRDFLFRKFKKNRNDKALYTAYCTQRNSVQRDIKMAKSEFFKGKVVECGRDSAKLWRRLNSLGHSEPKSKASIVLEQNGQKYFDSFNVGRIFNEYFARIASNLVDLLPTPAGIFSTTSAIFRDFYRTKGIRGPSFTLMPVSRHFVLQQLNYVDPRKSTGLDDISPRFLKDGAAVLAEPICHIINIPY